MPMRYVCFALVLANIACTAYFTLKKPSPSPALDKAQAALVNPVMVQNVTNELPPLIGSKK